MVRGFDLFGLAIKSIQRGNATIPSSVKTQDVTISGVDMNKSIVICHMSAPDSGRVDDVVSALLNSNTNIELLRGAATSYSVSVHWIVVEFATVKSLQRGTFTTSSTNVPINIPISSVNPSKSLVFWSSNWAGSSSINYATAITLLELSSNTQIAARTITHSYINYVSINWQVVEFY